MSKRRSRVACCSALAALLALEGAACSETKPSTSASPAQAQAGSTVTLTVAGMSGVAGRSSSTAPNSATAGLGAGPAAASGGSLAASSAGASAGTRSVEPVAGQSGTASAGVAGSLGDAGVAGAAGDDAGTTDPGSADAVTIVAQTALGPVTLMVSGASCTGGRCSLPAPADGKLEVDLTLEHDDGDPMPVLARWQGCGDASTTFFPVTPSGSSYLIHYASQFTGLRAGAVCTAEIVAGGWLVFAGNGSLKVTQGASFCTTLQVSEQGVNATCFPPPNTHIQISSDLPRWDCAQIELDGTVQESSHMGQVLDLTSAANQLVSCTGATQ